MKFLPGPVALGALDRNRPPLLFLEDHPPTRHIAIKQALVHRFLLRRVPLLLARFTTFESCRVKRRQKGTVD